MRLSKLAAGIAQSEIRIMSVECERVRGVNLAQGIGDTEVPEPVRRGAHQAIDAGKNQYSRLDGITELRTALARKLATYNGIVADPETEIVVTGGSTGGFYAAALALLNPGDEAIVFEPFYGYHVDTLEVIGVTPVFCRLLPPAWAFSREMLERLVTPKTRAIVINTPGNPSGKVFSRDELGIVAEVCVKHDLICFADEIYEYFLYDGRPHVSAATLPGMAKRTITISGFSKTFSITGWRVGYCVCPPECKEAIGYYSDLAYICAPTPFQHAVLAGLTELKEDFYRGLARDYAGRRELLCTTLLRMGLEPYVPAGSYYVLADVSRLPGTTSKEKAMYLLEQGRVAAVPGSSFYRGNGGDNLLRFCFAKTFADLREACRRLRQVAVPSLTATR